MESRKRKILSKMESNSKYVHVIGKETLKDDKVSFRMTEVVQLFLNESAPYMGQRDFLEHLKL